MRVRNNPNADEELKQCEKYIENKEKLQEVLKKSNKPVNIEIGMGKGEFISKFAYENPTDIYIGIEISRTVLALAIKKIKIFEEENNIKLDNLYLMSFDAINICEVFEKSYIDKIFLNFSDPWPKKKHSKRRLTHESFLKLYDYILNENGTIEIKTDNRGLFEYSIISINNFGFKIKEIYLDLHKANIYNVMTEYEMKFCDKGPIYKMILGKNN